MTLYTAARLLSVLALTQALPAGHTPARVTHLERASGSYVAESGAAQADDYKVAGIQERCDSLDGYEPITDQVECCSMLISLTPKLVFTTSHDGTDIQIQQANNHDAQYPSGSTKCPAQPESDGNNVPRADDSFPPGCVVNDNPNNYVEYNEPPDGQGSWPATLEPYRVICKKTSGAGRPKGAGTHVREDYSILAQLMTGEAEGPEHTKVSDVFATMAHFVHAAEEMQEELTVAYP